MKYPHLIIFSWNSSVQHSLKLYLSNLWFPIGEASKLDMGMPKSPTSKPYPRSVQLKLYHAFIFSVPILFTIILFLLFHLFYIKRRSRHMALSSPPTVTTRLNPTTLLFPLVTIYIIFNFDKAWFIRQFEHSLDWFVVIWRWSYQRKNCESSCRWSFSTRILLELERPSE